MLGYIYYMCPAGFKEAPWKLTQCGHGKQHSFTSSSTTTWKYIVMQNGNKGLHKAGTCTQMYTLCLNSDWRPHFISHID